MIFGRDQDHSAAPGGFEGASHGTHFIRGVHISLREHTNSVAGNSEPLEYSLAVDVFGRPVDCQARQRNVFCEGSALRQPHLVSPALTVHRCRFHGAKGDLTAQDHHRPGWL